MTLLLRLYWNVQGGRRIARVLPATRLAIIQNYPSRRDGLSDSGSRLPAGVYFYQVSTPDEVLRERMLLLPVAA